ncbi:MAG: hypothetical protein IJY74_05985, partial [Oscillospiraceae bacterium]|nr:hypothetical protein [Oscillospiraceae bacterium]
MAAEPVSKVFDIPRLYYFQSKNVFTGSKNNTFNYKISPAENLKVQIWHGLICSDKAEIEAEQEFPMDQDGFDVMIKWLEDM